MNRAARWIPFVFLVSMTTGCLRSLDRPAAEITGADAEGNSMRLSDFRGKVVLLDFWRDG